MPNIRVLVLGASGFVGNNITRVFAQKATFETLSTSRGASENQLFFDLLDESSWHQISEAKPDYIVDATGYGVVKDQTDLNLLYKINYIVKSSFIEFIFKQLPNVFWIQIGTAFEYSLEQVALTEESLCFPKTHYGISKTLFSSFLTESVKKRYSIFRPFGMFGETEAISKFFPMLITAQKEKRAINLSDGHQCRDYFYVTDLSEFLHQLIDTNLMKQLEGQVINVGSGIPHSLRQLSELLSDQIPGFDAGLWQWGAITQRAGENNVFYNASVKAKQIGFTTTPLEIAFKNTVAFYYD